MKITNKELKQIIKEELSKLLNEFNDLIDYNGYENYSGASRYIKGGLSPLDGIVQAESLKQTLRAVTKDMLVSYRRGVKALNNLKCT